MTLSNDPRPLFKDQMYGVRDKGLPGGFFLKSLSAVNNCPVLGLDVLLPTRLGRSEKAMAPHSSTLAWKIPWTEEPGRLQFVGSQRVGHD